MDNSSDGAENATGAISSSADGGSSSELGEPKQVKTSTTRDSRSPATPHKRTLSASPRKKTAAKKTATTRKPTGATPKPIPPKYPRHSVERALRIPRALLEQNAGKPASPAEAAKFLGAKSVSGEFSLEISSAKKYGLLGSDDGKLVVTDRAKRALRPQSDTDKLSSIREAVLSAPEISDVYNYYRGEYLPDNEFFTNALTERFKIPTDKVSDFRDVFDDSLKSAQLIDSTGAKPKLIDIGRETSDQSTTSARGASKRPQAATATSSQSVFVIQPFAPPYGGYYETLFKPAIQKTGLQPVRADDEIFGSGKIMDQVWRGIRDAKVLVAELSTRNANVYYELGLAHALGKPVVLIALDGEEVPFDVHHIRVIYYDITDPFWGPKLIDKLAENIQSAVDNPEEAVLEISGNPL